MALNFTTDIMSLYATKVGNDANYKAPGNFGLSEAETGLPGVDHVIVTGPGTYTAIPIATATTGGAVFQTQMKILVGSPIAAAGTVYAPGNVLTLVGGGYATTAQLTVATVKLVSATIVAGGSGYDGGAPSTFDVSVNGGTHSVTATVNVTTDGAGVVTTINSVSAGGSYTVLPTLAANAVTGDDGVSHGSGLTLNLVFGVNTFTVSRPGAYTTLPASPVAVTGGGGTGFTLTGSWGVVTVAVIDPGEYLSAPTVAFSAGAATATAVLGTASTIQGDEQKLLMLVEIMRSYIAESTNANQLKDMQIVFRKMLSHMKFGAKTSFTAASFATATLDAAMTYVAQAPRRTSNSI